MIKNILFDLGNVLIDIEPERAIKALQMVFGADYPAVAEKERALDLRHKFRTGQISEEQFFNTLQRAASRPPEGYQLIQAWNTTLIEIKAEKLKLLDQLNTSYELFLLSNTNHTHLQFIYRHLDRVHGIRDFDQRFFTQTFYSHYVQLQKPDPAIFQLVLDQARIKAQETLFVDDLAENTRVAHALGFQTLTYDPALDLASEIAKKIPEALIKSHRG